MSLASNHKLGPRAGYTLMEMVVSISLITMITALFIANYQSANRRTDLVMQAQKLVADFHQAQNNALGLVKYNGDVPASGWGLYFNLDQPDRYVLFADLDDPAEGGYMDYDPVAEGVEQYGARLITFPLNLEISDLVLDNSDIIQASVTFLPPDPQTNVHEIGKSGTGNSLKVILKDKRTGTYQTVEANSLGLAEIID